MSFDINRRAYNSTFRPVSKKRLAQMAAGTWKPKPRKPIRAVSNKMRHRITDYRDAAFAYWGKQCFLCGRNEHQTRLVVHHMDGRANGDNVLRTIPLCDGRFGCHAHNHNGMGDPRTAELNAEIEQKMKERESNGQNNHRM